MTSRGLAKDKGKNPSDDFTRINGIGHAIAGRLQASGIRTYIDLADLLPEEIAKLLSDVAGVSPKRVANEDWSGQARELAARMPHDDQQLARTGQHYENFVVRMLLNEDNNVRSTTIEHVQSGEVKRWAAWERAGLADFIEAQADLPPQAISGPPERAIGAAAQGEALSEPGATPEPVAIAAGALALRPERDMFRPGEPFTVSLTLDLEQLSVPAQATLDYTAVVLAKPLQGGPLQTIAEAHGKLPPARPAVIGLTSDGLPKGVYRLKAVVSVREVGSTRPAGLAAVREDEILHVNGG